MADLSSDRLIELIKIHEANFQKHLLGLDGTGNLFQYCIEHIERLENMVREHEKKKIFGKPRCLAIEDNGLQCKNIATNRITYFGDSGIYVKPQVTKSVVVGFCPRHRKVLEYSGSDVKMDENYYK